MDEQKQMTPAPYAAGPGGVSGDEEVEGGVPYAPREGGTPAANRKRGNHKKVEGRAYPVPTKQSDLKRRKIYV